VAVLPTSSSSGEGIDALWRWVREAMAAELEEDP
jgi:hypothetical protein